MGIPVGVNICISLQNQTEGKNGLNYQSSNGCFRLLFDRVFLGRRLKRREDPGDEVGHLHNTARR